MEIDGLSHRSATALPFNLYVCKQPSPSQQDAANATATAHAASAVPMKPRGDKLYKRTPMKTPVFSEVERVLINKLSQIFPTESDPQAQAENIARALGTKTPADIEIYLSSVKPTGSR